MRPTRRRLVRASLGAGAILFPGCLGTPAGDGGDDDVGLPEDDDDEANDDDGADGDCDPLELDLVDAPPHEPERPSAPDGPDDADEWDAHYLGTGMDDVSDVDFETVALSVRDPPMDPVEDTGDVLVYAELLDAREELDEVVTPRDDMAADRIEDVDFETQAVVLVASGFGSSSVRHQWVRVAHNCTELHLHGYDRRPYIQTDDVAARVSGVIVDRPEEYQLERVWVSLTVDEGTRVNFTTEADVQAVNENDAGEVEDVTVQSIQQAYPGGWWSDGTDETGVMVRLTDEDAVRAVVAEDEDIEDFLAETDFTRDSVYYVESVGPDTCHREIEISDVQLIDNGDAELAGEALVIEIPADACGEMITFPAVLVRVKAGIGPAPARFRITDGWGQERDTHAITMAEFAKE